MSESAGKIHQRIDSVDLLRGLVMIIIADVRRARFRPYSQLSGGQEHQLFLFEFSRFGNQRAAQCRIRVGGSLCSVAWRARASLSTLQLVRKSETTASRLSVQLSLARGD